MPNEAGIVLRNIEQHSFLIHFIASNISSKTAEKQGLLEENNVKTRAERLLGLLQSELQLVELKAEITNKARGEMDKQQREYFLQQQLKSIREELGGEPNEREIRDLQKRAEACAVERQRQKSFFRKILRSWSACTRPRRITALSITTST